MENVRTSDGPAYKYCSFVFAVPRASSLIKCDLKDLKIFLNNLSDLTYSRNLASNKVLWRRLQFDKDLLNDSEKD